MEPMNNQSSETAALTVDMHSAPTGDMGEKQLISGDKIAMRMWAEQPSDSEGKSSHTRDYETVGYVIEGLAELTVNGETIMLEPGISWLVPKGADHNYRILKPFRAIEATHPPA